MEPYERLTDDGLTQWHPAFLEMGKTLDECARKYRGFCQRYKPKKKSISKPHWGSKLLAGINIVPRKKGKPRPQSQFTLWEENPGSGSARVPEGYPKVPHLQCRVGSEKFTQANRATKSDPLVLLLL